MIHSPTVPRGSRSSPSAEQSNSSSQEAQIIERLLHMQSPFISLFPDLCSHFVVLSWDPALIPTFQNVAGIRTKM